MDLYGGDPAGAGAPNPTDAGSGDEEHEIHGRAVMKALGIKGDAKAFSRALKDFVRSCYDEEMGSPEPEALPPL